MHDPVRVAVLGYGLAGRVFHCPFISSIPGLHLEAIMQRHSDDAAEAYPQARILRSPEAVFADPDIDLVVVATPNETHEAFARAALAAGKHVVVDKPVAPTSAGILALAEAARAAGKHLIPFHNRRWDGDFLTVQKLLADRTLGRLVSCESHFDRFRPLPRAGTWKESASPANGLLFDLGPHLLDQALALFGLPSSITASVRTDRDSTAIEDAFDICLSYPRMLFWARASMLAAENSPRFLLHGTRGSFRKWGVDPQEPALVAGASVPPLGSPEPWLPEQPSAWGTLSLAPNPAEPAALTREPLASIPGDYRLFYANVRDTIQRRADLAVPAEAGLQVIHLLELARRSSHEGRTLPVEPIQ